MGIMVLFVQNPCDVQLFFMRSIFNAPCYSSFFPYTHPLVLLVIVAFFKVSLLVTMLEGNSSFDGLFSDVI